MTKHTLFVCTSCHRSSQEKPEKEHKDGNRLFAQLNTISEQILSTEELEIQSVSCLWACSRSCVVAISSPKKPTYLITDLPAKESAAPLLELMQVYLSDENGTLPWKKLPESLRSAIFAKIPPIS